MKKNVRKRLRRWYFDKYVFWAVHLYFTKQLGADLKPPTLTPRNELEQFAYELWLTFQDSLWMQAYQEALEWAYGIAHRDLRVSMPAKGKVSSKTIQVKLRSDL
jgi:hypothetical protein